MKATDWEFKNRAMVFGMILGISFAMYSLDQQNTAAALASWMGPRGHWNADVRARILFAFAALLLILAALIRTWASAYLHAGVVYAPELKTASLVADGPYRQVRNPLYFANVLMAIALGSMMSRVGFVVALVAMVIFCYRLIFREESELQTRQGEAYKTYRGAVPRLWPSPWPRIPQSGRSAKWAEGFWVESWYWGFAAALVAFALTLKLLLFFAILAASLLLFWFLSTILKKKQEPASTATETQKVPHPGL
jgi:protein-S-isoprenylcysteine O-methyltransferase Ste14